MSEPESASQAFLSPEARQDIRDILTWSLDKFGEVAAKRYRALLIQALHDIKADPLRPGTRVRPDLAKGARTYHLSRSRRQIEGETVKTPRHFILYRIEPAGPQIARILHDSRDVTRHLPDDYKR